MMTLFPSGRRARLTPTDDAAQGDKEVMNRLADRPDRLPHYLNIVLQTLLTAAMVTLIQKLASSHERAEPDLPHQSVGLPYWAVEEKDIEPAIEVRLTCNLSFPERNSINSNFAKECTSTFPYDYVTNLARRIEFLAPSHPGLAIKMIKGDAKGAIRHLMTNAAHVRSMAVLLPDIHALIIDLSAPFGWTPSPAF
ncbi:hypothetical protein BBJ28_00010837 [Nothophytophthora sp. Chile5]|nr:hypothetical protein BBJ28_00010837 [Nothophytophthora sp. Chile5]